MLLSVISNHNATSMQQCSAIAPEAHIPRQSIICVTPINGALWSGWGKHLGASPRNIPATTAPITGSSSSYKLKIGQNLRPLAISILHSYSW
jgi:hypothetical protein